VTRCRGEAAGRAILEVIVLAAAEGYGHDVVVGLHRLMTTPRCVAAITRGVTHPMSTLLYARNGRRAKQVGARPRSYWYPTRPAHDAPHRDAVLAVVVIGVEIGQVEVPGERPHRLYIGPLPGYFDLPDSLRRSLHGQYGIAMWGIMGLARGVPVTPWRAPTCFARPRISSRTARCSSDGLHRA